MSTPILLGMITSWNTLILNIFKLLRIEDFNDIGLKKTKKYIYNKNTDINKVN